jgi:hypothetical protein
LMRNASWGMTAGGASGRMCSTHLSWAVTFQRQSRSDLKVSDQRWTEAEVSLPISAT